MTILVRNGRKLRKRTATGPKPNKSGWNVSHPDGNAYFADYGKAQAFHEAVTAAIAAGVQPPQIPSRSERLQRPDNSQPKGISPNGGGWLVNRGRGKVYFADYQAALAYRAEVVAAMDARQPLPDVPPRSDRVNNPSWLSSTGRPKRRSIHTSR